MENSNKLHKTNSSARIIFTLISIAIFITLFIFLFSPHHSLAQESSGWTKPYLLYQSNYHVNNPIIISDVFDNLHAFWIENSDEDYIIPALFHSELINDYWSIPINILISPDNGPMHAPEITADIYGNLHLIFQGSNNQLFYSSVNANKANIVTEWQTPKSIAQSWLHNGITSDKNGNIHIAFPGVGTSGVYYMTSINNGENWSSPVLIAPPETVNNAADYAQINVDGKGTLHVVWTEFHYPKSWPPSGIFYTSSQDGGTTWSRPIKIAGEGYDQIFVNTDSNNNIHLVWNGMIGIGGRYYSNSSDTKNFTNPYPIVPAGIAGTSGYPRIGFTSDGISHFITTLDQEGGIHYAYTYEGKWTETTNISGAVNSKHYKIKSIEYPNMDISSGNKINVIYEVGFEEIYYLSLTTLAPIKYKVVNSTPEEEPTTPEEKTSKESFNQETSMQPTDIAPETNILKTQSNPALPIILSLIPLSIFIGIVIIWQFIKKSR